MQQIPGQFERPDAEQCEALLDYIELLLQRVQFFKDRCSTNEYESKEIQLYCRLKIDTEELLVKARAWSRDMKAPLPTGCFVYEGNMELRKRWEECHRGNLRKRAEDEDKRAVKLLELAEEEGYYVSWSRNWGYGSNSGGAW
ncbi:MAG: hypothetical protein Q9188_004964 [Gyalolechia gomerana]